MDLSKSKIFFILILVILPVLVFANLEKVVFTTDVQTIKPNTLSGPITIQLQDSLGNSYQTSETLDVQFISTSPTGEFLNSSGNPVTTYMSKNTANKTFYYRDSNEGIFTITVGIRGRDSGIELDANQQITISANSNITTTSNNNGEVLGASVVSSQSSGSSSLTNVSTLGEKLEIFAGEDRISSPGSPIWFQAVMKKNTTSINPELNWSFGDGDVGVGALVSHTYKYTGDYVVVLSARAGDIFSVSRLKVRVVDAQIKVQDKGDYLEIFNDSNSELNLFNWKVENQSKGFVFQPNTIILPRSSIKIDKNLLRLKGYDNCQGIALKNSVGATVFVDQSNNDLSELNRKLSEAKDTLLDTKIKMTSKLNTVPNQYQNANVLNGNFEQPQGLSNENSLSQDDFATSLPEIIYESPQKSNFVSKLTNFIKRVFSK